MKQAHAFSLKAFYILCPPLCLRSKFSTSSVFRLCLLWLFFVFSGLGEVKGQNVINIYHPDLYINEPSELLLNGNDFNVSGEYQVRVQLLNSYWGLILNNNLGNYRMIHEIEMVSFPFFPVTDGTNNRKLTTISDDLYITNENSTNIDDYSRWENVDWLSDYNADFIWKRTGNGVNEKKQMLASLFFNGNPISTNGPNDGRTVLPHSIFKHTFHLLYCGTSSDLDIETPIDTYSYVIDLTRGKMAEYPFVEENNAGSNEDAHDIFIYPFIELSNSFDVTDNPPFHTIDYFPKTDVAPYPIEGIDNCDEYISYRFYPEIGEAINNPSTTPNNYLHPAPFSLVGFHMQGAGGARPLGFRDNNGIYEETHGIEHEYEINENLDLTLVNPEEKIIYNPSITHITASDLVFPSNYKFMTVRQNYATRTQTEAEASESTLCDMLNLEHLDLRDVPVPTDLQDYVSYEWTTGGTTTTIDAPSFYILEDNSKLTIEPCTQIFDVTFVVKDGAELHYDSDQTFGNFEIISENQQDVIDLPMLSEKKCNDCRCMQQYDYEQGLIVDNSETIVWQDNLSIRGQIIVKNGGTLRIENATIGFADTERVGVSTGIIVEAGGTLEVYDSRLDALLGEYCNRTESWDGILLHGTGNGTKDLHAVLDIQNSSIHNARIAIKAQGAKYSNINGEEWESGGEVTAENVRFLNNYISFYGSSFNPSSEFLSCVFEQGSLLRDTELSSNGAIFAHALFFDMEEMIFKSCRFSNQISESFDYEDRGIGIFSINTPVYVGNLTGEEGVNNPINQESVFHNLYKGIDHYAFLTQSSLKVENTHFELVLRGITANSSNLDQVNNCNFQMGTNLGRKRENAVSPPITTYGIYAYGAQNYQYQFNDFELLIPSNFVEEDGSLYTDSFNAYGIISNNSAEGGGSILDNNFGVSSDYKQLDVGNQTEENNMNLQILCNEYNTQIEQGWYINPEAGNLQIPDYFANQGDGCFEDAGNGNPAGNLFYDNCNSGDQDIKVSFFDPIPDIQSDENFDYWAMGNLGNLGYPCSSGLIDIKGGCSSDNHSQYCSEADLEPVVLAMTANYTPIEIAGLIESNSYSEIEQNQLTYTTLGIYETKGETQNAVALVNSLSSNQALDLSMKYSLSLEEINTAQNKLNEMAVQNVYDSEYIGFYQLLINVKASNRHYHELTPVELQTVESIANSNSYAAVNAQALLTMLNQTPYDRVPMLGTGHSQKKESVADDTVTLYPNPIRNNLTIHIEQNDTHLTIYDIRGILLKSMVMQQGKQNLNLDLPSGTYFLSLEDNLSIRTKKIVVAH